MFVKLLFIKEVMESINYLSLIFKTFSTDRTFRPPSILTNIQKVPMQNEKLSPVIKPFTKDLFKNQEINDSHIKAKAADNTLYFSCQDIEKKQKAGRNLINKIIRTVPLGLQ